MFNFLKKKKLNENKFYLIEVDTNKVSRREYTSFGVLLQENGVKHHILPSDGLGWCKITELDAVVVDAE